MSIFKKSIKVNSALQLVVCFVLLFIVPSLPKEFQFISYFITLIALVLISAFLIEKHNQKYISIAIGIIAIRIINHNFGFDNIVIVLDLLTVFLFIWIALLLIKGLFPYLIYQSLLGKTDCIDWIHSYCRVQVGRQ